MKARLDLAHPTYECCELLFEYRDDDSECCICGGVFDWFDLLEAYNPEDYEEIEDEMPSQQTPWDLPPDADEAAAQDALDEELYMQLPWGKASQPLITTRSPTRHLSNPKTHRRDGPDPLLAALPEGTI